ncbi:MAG: hypothetical protein Q8Q85_09795 [Gemmatimonadales bacterium]|nr:hypothetical protein [Gemmatimonadales bacterium]
MDYLDGANWGAMGPPDVLPTGYGETPMDRGGPNFGPGTDNADAAPGWMTAGPGVPEYMGASAKKSALQWQPRDATLSDGTMVRQHPDGSITIVAATQNPFVGIVGRTITQSSHPAAWSTATTQVGLYKPPILSALLQTGTQLTTAAIRAGAPPPPRSRKPRFVPGPMESGGGPGVPTWAWVAGGGALLLVTILMLSRKGDK